MHVSGASKTYMKVYSDLTVQYVWCSHIKKKLIELSKRPVEYDSAHFI